jgi:hypothetical protein
MTLRDSEARVARRRQQLLLFFAMADDDISSCDSSGEEESALRGISMLELTSRMIVGGIHKGRDGHSLARDSHANGGWRQG